MTHPTPESMTSSAMAHRVLRTLLTLTVATVMASCGEDTPTSSPSPQASPAGATETSPEAVTPLVGRWEQTHYCEDLVRAFDAAGLAAAAPSCEGKHPQLHFHFFTEGGQFGSLDKNGQQVGRRHAYARTRYHTNTAPGDPRIAAGLHHRILDGQRRVRRNDVEARAL